jgi:hypothetical protein
MGKSLMALKPRPLFLVGIFTRLVAYLLFAAATAIFFPPGSHAAEIRCASTWGAALSNGVDLLWDLPSGRAASPASCLQILIKGEIVADDSAKFAQLLRSNHPFVHSVILWSSGGSVEAAMEIGRMIRKDLLETTAPIDVKDIPDGAGFLSNPKCALCVPSELPDPSMQYLCEGEACHCASACFLIWAAGVSRSGNALGLHRPSIRSTSFGDLPPQRASRLYRLLLGEIDDYLAEMEIPRRYIEIMTDTSSNEMRWLNLAEGQSLTEVPSVVEWLAATCGTMSESDVTFWLQVSAKLNRLTPEDVLPQDKMLYEQLSKRFEHIDYCKHTKIDIARDAIAEINLAK